MSEEVGSAQLEATLGDLGCVGHPSLCLGKKGRLLPHTQRRNRDLRSPNLSLFFLFVFLFSSNGLKFQKRFMIVFSQSFIHNILWVSTVIILC